MPAQRVIAQRRRAQQLRQQRDGEEGHQDGRDALGQPVAQPVVRADDEAPEPKVLMRWVSEKNQYRPKSLAPSKAVSAKLMANVATAELCPAVC